MAYLGRGVDIGMFEKQILIPDSTTTSFTLTYAVGSANSLQVSYGGVLQEPGVAYSVSGGGQNIVFSEAPATGTTLYIIYYGKQLTTPRAAGQETTKQTFTGNGSTVTYTLTDPPVVPAGIMVFVDGILQREGSGNNYVSSGSTITFSTAPDTSAEIDVYTLVKEKVSIDTVADGSITFTKLVAGSPTWNGAGETVIASASTGNSLRITNTGSGNALLIEDSASTDSTPFVVTAAGDVGIGTASPTQKLDVVGSIKSSALTSGRVPYASTGGLLVDSANMTFNGTSLTLTSDTTVPTLSVLGNSATPNLRLGSQGNTSVYWQIGRDNVTTGDFIFSTQTAERVRFTDAGNVGIGTASPSTEAAAARLALVGTAAQDANSLATSNTKAVLSLRGDSNSGYSTAFGTLTTTDDQYIQGVNFSGGAASCHLVLQPFSGNLGIGTGNTSPASRLDIFTNNGGGVHYPITLSANNAASAKTNYTQIGFGIAQGAAGSETGGFELKSLRNNTFVNLAQYDGAAGSAAWKFYTEGTERMRIDSSGNLLVGRTSASVVGAGSRLQTPSLTIEVGGDTTGSHWNRTDTNGAWVAQRFYAQGSQVGFIQVNTSSTTFSTTSDYRLKENVAPMTGALAKVAQLKPVTYKWKADGSHGQGFIAHELQEVVPDCVTGTKDALKEDGNPEYQGVDTSFLVATLTAAIQELKAIVDAQAVEIAALKVK